ncbi:MAG: M16 family metallopeptidase [Candidatus Saccharicenans sp.]|nr:insulinase family protein [Candidatus Aminicenantes bacterium]
MSNGLKVYLLSGYPYPLTTVVLAVKAGIEAENSETNGWRHLLEHCLLFRQSRLIEKNQLFSTIKKTGLYYNAHTDQDLMTFEFCLPKEYLEEALGRLKEIVFNFDFTEEALENEKKIISLEIKEIERNPEKLGLSLIYKLIFGDSNYGLPVYGQEKVIQQATLKDLEKIHQQYFWPNNSALVVIGDFSLEKIKPVITSLYSDLSPGQIQTVAPFPSPKLSNQDSLLELTMKIPETYLLAGLPGPPYNLPEAINLELLIEILGGGMNPLLYGALAGYPDLVTSMRLHYLSHERAGLIYLSAITTEKNISTLKRLLQSFFASLPEINYSPEDYPPGQQYLIMDFLQGGKNRIKWLSEKLTENPIALGMALSKHLLLAAESGQQNYLKQVESLNSSDLRKVARRYFKQARPVWVIIKPEKK